MIKLIISSIDTSAAENFSPSAKHFLPTLYSEEQLSDTEEQGAFLSYLLSKSIELILLNTKKSM